jgi:hypothetical protein
VIVDYRKTTCGAGATGAGAQGGGKKPFAYQAAAFSFWAPIASVGLGCVVSGMFPDASTAPGGMRASAAVVLATVVLLNVAAVVLGAMALLAMRRLGRQGLLWRSLGGVVMAVVVLVSLGSTAQRTMGDLRMSRSLVGVWEMETTTEGKTAAKIDMTLRADRTAAVRIEGAGKAATLTGVWAVLKDAGTGKRVLAVKWDAGQANVLGSDTMQGVRWPVESVGEAELRLSGDAGKVEVYRRVGK